MSRIGLLFAVFLFLACSLWARANDSTRESAVSAQETNVENIPLRPLGSDTVSAAPTDPQAPTTNRTVTTVVGALAVCLGVFFLVVWVAKRNAPTGFAPLPKEVLESLGRSSFGTRQHLQLVRVGRKLVLLHVTATHAEPLTEIVEPAEVERLVGLCQQTKAQSVTASFREVLTDYESEPTAKGFLGDAGKSDWELATRTTRRRVPREEMDG